MESEPIFAIHSTLHLIFHRNKNQHGKTKWWKWLSILKRVTLNLARSLRYEASHSHANEASTIYRQYLATDIMPRCYLAFSTVVADVQFSTVGTVLLATLARLAKATGIDKDLKNTFRVDKASRSRAPSISLQNAEDLGEILSRKPPSPLPKEPVTKESDVARSGSISKIANTAGGHTKKSKKRKKKDAIDDLFNGLL
ncbi:hypothetical protein P170DRAFT_510080 [Aspergillus steynii IBT 23096]|uniref:RNase MRP protein 1 RNA binding domain-containing protein n=1 Tax=Aspergillus steynii IBT 23096 TaxID=1392250 RepID=A0A2I2G9I6_9EURO|nr:uncharacterized protein P170DRAFT_510080 [Aspergillus steynii IBT 23096]PLB49540.1 hypothetical protein P170DRAFT_510080 [Aspergillus steynii IBT 23096]